MWWHAEVLDAIQHFDANQLLKAGTLGRSTRRRRDAGTLNPPGAGRWDTLAAGVRDAGTRTTAGGGRGCGTLGRSARRRRKTPLNNSVNVQMLRRSDAQPAKGGTLGRPA
jgi:hypothetical protein